jgi:hypothetical protein
MTNKPQEDKKRTYHDRVTGVPRTFPGGSPPKDPRYVPANPGKKG